MASSLLKAISSFGIVSGIRFFIAYKRKSASSIKIPKTNHVLTLREQTTDISTFKKIFLNKEYDVSFNFSPKYIVDAGAYIGLSPVFFSLKYPDAKIVCVEPNEANYQLLLQNAQLPNITCVKGAIWNQSGHLDLKNSAKQNAHKVIESDSGSVRAYTIDEIMQLHNIPHIDILKMDVEGAELEIFSKGFEKWLPKTKAIMIELHDRMKPKCSGTFYSVMDQYGFSYCTKGENEIAINSKIK